MYMKKINFMEQEANLTLKQEQLSHHLLIILTAQTLNEKE